MAKTAEVRLTSSIAGACPLNSFLERVRMVRLGMRP